MRNRGADRRRHLRRPLADADAVVVRVERLVAAAPEGCSLRLLDRRVHRGVHALQGARHHPRAEIPLIGVSADAEDLLLVSSVEDAEAALARDLELDDRALGDLVEGLLLAL